MNKWETAKGLNENQIPLFELMGVSKAMWESDHKEGWAPKNWSFQTAMLGKTLESPLDNKELKPVNPKGS